MSFNTYGHVFRVTTWGESHGPALGATVDGCPPGVPLEASDLQVWLDKRKPGQNKFTTQRREADEVEILSGVFEGVTTGTPIQVQGQKGPAPSPLPALTTGVSLNKRGAIFIKFDVLRPAFPFCQGPVWRAKGERNVFQYLRPCLSRHHLGGKPRTCPGCDG